MLERKFETWTRLKRKHLKRDFTSERRHLQETVRGARTNSVQGSGSAFQGRELRSGEALWHVGGDYPSDWPKPADGWTVTLEGEPSLRAQFTSLASFEHARERSLAEHTHASDIATAMQVVNSIPALCEAAPGIRGTFELAPVFSGVGMR